MRVVDSLRSGWIGTGPKVQRLERMLEEYVRAAHVRCLSSCTAALMLGLQLYRCSTVCCDRKASKKQNAKPLV